jgi:hypothetical protein
MTKYTWKQTDGKQKRIVCYIIIALGWKVLWPCGTVRMYEASQICWQREAHIAGLAKFISRTEKKRFSRIYFPPDLDPVCQSH